MQPHLSAEAQDRLVIFSCCVAKLPMPQQRNLPKAGDALEQLVALRVHRPAQLGILLLDLQHLVAGLLTQLRTHARAWATSAQSVWTGSSPASS